MGDYTIDELAKLVNKHPETLRQLARLRRLPGAYRIGNEWRINRELFQAHRNGGADRAGSREQGERI
jgi:excisionase family DNA binding protein